MEFALFVGIIGYRTGVDNIDLRWAVKIYLLIACTYQLTGNGGGLCKVELTA